MQLKRRTKTNYIVIHCSYTPPTMDIGATEIDKWHRERGWWGIGYHYIIRRDGTIEYGRPYDTIGAHVQGHNDDSIGICVVGGSTKSVDKAQDNFTVNQGIALHELLQQLKQLYPEATVVGHKDLDPTRECPCFDLTLTKRFSNNVAEHDVTRSRHDDHNL